ncbi:hypothetical protein DPMN_083952 [Dreissena polymorpha]|uniref:Uncharacterized protein n=1 Tax=Dreissena polymorpha TaxID=45954 RepID=A0A9D4BIT2_DREPO|nr:hypothetical protein DPMN_083952 [Dreissena polymorpha]
MTLAPSLPKDHSFCMSNPLSSMNEISVLKIVSALPSFRGRTDRKTVLLIPSSRNRMYTIISDTVAMSVVPSTRIVKYGEAFSFSRWSLRT